MITKKLTDAQREFLEAIRDNEAYYGGANGGRARTKTVLRELGLIDQQENLTQAGRLVLIDGRYFYSD